jgi:hypothetical protein
VIDPQFLLAYILRDESVRQRLIAAICAVERVSYQMQATLLSAWNRLNCPRR